MDNEEILMQLTTINATLEHQSTLLERIDRCIYGNGQVGLLARMGVLEEKQHGQEGICNRHIKQQRWLMTTIIAVGAILVTTVSIFI